MQRIHEGNTALVWYEMFAEGMKARMGIVVKKNLALKTELILAIISEANY